MSTGKSNIVENSKPCTNLAIVRLATFIAKAVPGQDLLPAPKGPPTIQSSIASCGTDRGAGGYNRSVSLKIA
ncbi:hypothetical protein Leryth_023366 [Lithospermum erythrorhizon]|nr:hypothetical protein Leryth_023366 [Lithospermum erythrorhizon]